MITWSKLWYFEPMVSVIEGGKVLELKMPKLSKLLRKCLSDDVAVEHVELIFWAWAKAVFDSIKFCGI